ncbi:phosphohydrolase [Klebsiella michiganensis]|uniref:phosphohydrolase n=1 Tax=Klebsiella michiganensis TaxID=1134687 RepID=UPI0022A3874F|nr:phosphohydrolase [Klebsiella michiganensis]ELC0837792.1 phosphohydrolase [Klebsiella michiganensis]ELF4771664.1 phosphohydrolase [Klebsiella michiganensis]ELP0295903.1 phosphohydrolase [Klebsiella michiganensis]MDS7758461.1 phosphohydrolase [Klebsiella michiganensis]HCU0556879.1 phosphohydrolase [Klebsiella michiganensis]
MDLYHWQQRFEAWLSQYHGQEDAAHDISHFRRVWATAQQLAEETAADRLVILTACYFHDIVSLAKNHPERSRSSAMAAEKTLAILQSAFPDFPPERYAAVLHAIEAHSFSAAVAPQSEEAKIVQDADRLEALGAIGLARVFAVSGALNNSLFDARDPFAERRELDDKTYALDHFQCKLLRLPKTMQTEKGRAMAVHNARFLVQFMAKLSAELRGEPMALDAEVLQRFDPLA